MIIKRPSIFIYTNEPDRDFLREVCAGIEEEGVFYEIIPGEAADLDELAYDAANDSMLGSGVGISGADEGNRERQECGGLSHADL